MPSATAAYMSPEQAEGKTVHARTDLFSLGIVLFEMATGERPFAGDSHMSILSAILKDTPKPVTELRPDVPGELAVTASCDGWSRRNRALGVRSTVVAFLLPMVACAARIASPTGQPAASTTAISRVPGVLRSDCFR